jgi:hypothetical protein
MATMEELIAERSALNHSEDAIDLRIARILAVLDHRKAEIVARRKEIGKAILKISRAAYAKSRRQRMIAEDEQGFREKERATTRTYHQRNREDALASGLVVARKPKTPEEKKEYNRQKTREYHARIKAAAQAYRAQQAES